MNNHFAASWLQSLSGKLEGLQQWSWASDKRGECGTHRNLFREFFSANFQKTLALVDEEKKTSFVACVDRNLYKFDETTQQFPLGCLCSLLQHGKDSPRTQEKVAAWADYLLQRLRSTGASVPGRSHELEAVVEECMSPEFQKFVPLMEEGLRTRLADGLGDRLLHLPEAQQRRVLEGLPALSERVEQLINTCTAELNEWLSGAPRFPATPVSVADSLAKMENPLIKFFTAMKDPARKEAFLVSTALTLQGLRTRFRWMCAVEPDLERLGAMLQQRLFTVEGQGPVMEMWLSSRLKKYNAEAAGATARVLADPARCEQLRGRLQAIFPERKEDDPESGWLQLDGPTGLADELLAYLCEACQSFTIPKHTLARESVTTVLQRLGRGFEVDTQRMRARAVLAAAAPDVPPPTTVPPPASVFRDQALAVAQASAAAAEAAAGRPAAPPAPPGAPPGAAVSSAIVPVQPGTGVPPPSAVAVPQAPPAAKAEPDNLVDFLLNEALEKVQPHVRAQIVKMGHGVYRFGAQEVTLHTQNGSLYVYRIGEVVRHMPIQQLLQETGLVPAPAAAAAGQAAAAATAPAGSGGAVDASSVARIALMSKQISSGATTTTPSAAAAQPFHNKATDPQALMSKRVEAATKAMDISKQIVRRSVNFEDEKLLRKLLKKGLQYDKTWQAAYHEYCSGRGVPADAYQTKEFVAGFIERNLANSINQDWAQKVIYKKKEDKKDKKKDKEKKDKKRKAGSDSSSGEGGAGGPSGAAAAAAPGVPPMAPGGRPPHPGMEMPMWPGMPYGMGHPGMGTMGTMMPPGMPGMGGPMGYPMMPDGSMPGMGMPMMDDGRKRKDKEKSKKAKKER